jgi:hypothetical protein
MEESLEYKGYTIKIEIDSDPMNPRTEFDNACKMACFHKRYNLGDKHDYNHDDYNNWDEMEKAIKRNEDVALIEPLYMYDHSGITISTSSFSCRWDSGQIGFVYITKQSVRECYGIKRITKKYLEKAQSLLDGEVKTYDNYLTGSVYGYNVVKVDEDGDEEDIDSCWGFFGYDHEKSGLLDYARNAIDCDIEYKKKQETVEES